MVINVLRIYAVILGLIFIYAFVSRLSKKKRIQIKTTNEENDRQDEEVKSFISNKKREEKDRLSIFDIKPFKGNGLLKCYINDTNFVENIKANHMLKGDLIAYCATVMNYDISSLKLNPYNFTIDYADMARLFSTMKDQEDAYNITYTKNDIDKIIKAVKTSISTIESKVSSENNKDKEKPYYNVTEGAFRVLDEITGRYVQSTRISNVYNENYACTSILASGRYPALRFAIGNGLYVDKENTTVSVADLRDVFSQKVFMDAFENNFPERPFVVMADVFTHMLRVGGFPERSLIRCVNKDSLDIYHMLKNKDLTVDEVQNLTHTWERNPANQI